MIVYHLQMIKPTGSLIINFRFPLVEKTGYKV
jgi:hypothetical protein